MALFTIHYENSVPVKVSYTLDNEKHTENIDDLLLDFLNTFEDAHKYFKPECEHERFNVLYPDVHAKISGDYNYDVQNGTFGSPFDIYMNIKYPLRESLSYIGEKIQNEILQDNVYISSNENKLIFNQALKMQTSALLGFSNDEFSHVYELMHFDPTVFSVYKHFHALKNDLSVELAKNVISLNHSLNKWQRFYLQSDDFTFQHLKTILELSNWGRDISVRANNYMWNDFGTRSDIVSFCIEYASAETPMTFAFSQAHKYRITKGDMFRAMFKKDCDRICSEYASKLQSDIEKAYSSFVSKEKIDKKIQREIFSDSNRILIDAFYSPEKHGRIKSVSFQHNNIYAEYEDFSSGEITSTSFPYPYTLDRVFEPLFGYKYDSKFISPACAMYMAFSCNIDNNPFLYPILHSDFDMYEYVNMVPFHSFSYMVKDLEEIMNIDYRNATFDIETDSLTRVLVCLIDSLHRKDSNVKKCLYCGKFFIASSGYDKYCDAALPKDIRERSDYNYKKACSYLAKQQQALNRTPEIKELQSARKNEQYYFLRESEFFDMELSVYNDRYNVAKSTLLATSGTEFESVTLKLFSALRCGILLCKYDSLKNILSKKLSNPDYDKEMLLAYGKTLLTHDFNEDDLPSCENNNCRYYDKNNLFPYQFDWDEEIKKIIENNINNFPAKAKNRMKVMQSMIKTYALWVKKNDILTENTVDVTSKTFEAIKLLDSCISDEHSLFNGKTKITLGRPLKR